MLTLHFPIANKFSFQLEENIRTIVFCGDWVKLMDDWLVEFSMVQSATSTLGTAQKRAPSGRRYKKRLANDEATADGCPENFVWWRGGKFTKFIFQKAVLPKSMVRKAARQGNLFLTTHIIPEYRKERIEMKSK